LSVELRGITKNFGALTANDNINLRVETGEIHAILGENGAGKSTLMNILYGLLAPDSGQILIDENPITIFEPSDALAAGIAMVHQHFMLIPVFTVAENIILGHEKINPLGVLNLDHARSEIARISKEFNFDIDPDAVVETLPVGIQQRVEIIRALIYKAKVLILDEPTAVLTPQETDEMVGRPVDLNRQKRPATIGNEILSISNLSVTDDNGRVVLHNISLSVHAGEIVAVAVVQGNGQTELARAILNLEDHVTGEILIDGKNIVGESVRRSLQSGIAFIPESRELDGLIGSFSIAENLILDTHDLAPNAKGFLLATNTIRIEADQRITEFDIRSQGANEIVSSLSGGNKQKVVLARELSRPVKIVVASQPTRGLDVGSIEFIHEKIVQERDLSRAVLLFSTELDEVFALADRIVVMYQGSIIDIVPASISRSELGLLMAGIKPKVKS